MKKIILLLMATLMMASGALAKGKKHKKGKTSHSSHSSHSKHSKHHKRK